MSSRFSQAAGLGVLLALVCESGASAVGIDTPGGIIFGRVDVRLPLGPAHVRPTTRSPEPMPARGVPDRAQSVVYLKTAPQGAFEASPRGRVTLDQKQETFVPYVLPVTVGTTVEFPNSDPFFHNVFSLSSPKKFDLGRYPQGQTKSVLFDKPGVVRVFCEIHSHMSAFILVFAHRYFAATGPLGEYRIDGVPPGSYDVVVWTDGKERRVATVSVASGQRVQQDFEVR